VEVDQEGEEGDDERNEEAMDEVVAVVGFDRWQIDLRIQKPLSVGIAGSCTLHNLQQ